MRSAIKRDILTKRSIIFGIAIFIVFFIANVSHVQGHDPAEIRLEYHYADQILEVWIYHPVSYPDRHWVNNVQIRNNDVLVGNYSYDSQPPPVSWTYNYSISAVHFDILNVRVFCNYQGDTEIEILVLDPDNPTTRLPTPTKLIGISLTGYLIATISAVIFLSKAKKILSKN